MKLGIIGCGGRISGMVATMKRLAPELRVVAVVDPDEAAARARLPEDDRATAAFYPGLDQLVAGAKPDALVIGTRCDLHTPYAIQAARHPLPLFLEKPVATSMEQAIALERAFSASPCRALVSFPLRASPLCRRARGIIEQGGIGSPEHILAVNYVGYGSVYFDSWYRDHRITQGLFLQKATHDFNYMAYLIGAPITRVAAMMSRGRVYRDAATRAPGDADGDALWREGIGTPESGMNEDSSSALLEFANGAKGVYTQVFFTRGKSDARGATIAGLRATLWFDWYKNEMRRWLHQEPFTETTTPEGSASHFGGDDALARNFIDMVRSGAQPLAPIAAGLASVNACLAARESAMEGRFVDVRKV